MLLAAYAIYQLVVGGKKGGADEGMYRKVGILFCVSSVVNALWIFAWHYRIIYLSMILMLFILICLINIVGTIRKETLSVKEKIFVKLPFSVYFGWITVATIANATTMMVSMGWNGFGISEAVWTVIVIAVGAVIGILTILRNRDYAYGLVIIWAYTAILTKHTSVVGFGGMYLAVIIAVVVCLALILTADVYTIVKRQY